MSSPWIRSVALALAGLCAGAAAIAQEADAGYYDGRWTARLACPSGAGACIARVVIDDFGGTWQDVSAGNASKRLCGGKKMPLTVQGSTASQFAFTVFGDSVSARCPTLSVLVRPVDANTLQGSVEIGLHANESAEIHAAHSGLPAAAAAPASGADGTRSIRLVRR
jgi:hypothetical protein